MKIIELYAENVKRLVAVQIKPTDNFIQITGDNEQGKTSVLDAIWWAISGGDNVQKMPIRQGQDKARIEIDLGELKVIRRFRKLEGGSYSTTLEIKNAEGFKASSPQAMLDKMVGSLAMDPIAFMKAKPAEQALQLRSLVKGFDFAQNDADFKKAFELRTETGRQIRQLEGQLASFSDLPAEIPEWKDPVEVLQSLERAADGNRKIQTELDRRRMQGDQLVAQTTKIEGLQKAMLDLKDKMKQLELQLTEACDYADALETSIKTAPELPAMLDLKTFEADLNDVQRQNKIAERAKSRDKIAGDIKERTEIYDLFTADLEQKRKAEREAIDGAELPIEGLGFTADGVTIKGHPLEQASAAQQLKLSVAIAAAQNPKLRVMRLVDGSLLDAKAMVQLEEIAKELDYQIWIERVATGQDIGIVIEEGRVKGQELEHGPEQDTAPATAGPGGETPPTKNGDDAQSKPFTLL